MLIQWTPGTKDHQTADWSKHKSDCTRIKKARTHLQREEEALRAESPDIFTEDVGHFWGLIETRNYMRARYGVVEATLKLRTFEAIEAAHEHLADMLQLCRGDNMGVRDMVPALLLRMGRDQECYDFIKWHATMGADDHYDWGDMSLPFLNVRDADVFEDVNYLCGRWGNLSHVVAATLLKIRLLLALKACVKGSAVL